MELVFKKMKQLLRLNQIRSKHRTSVEATVRALLIAWALHEGTTTLLRTLLSATRPAEMAVVSSWLLSGLGLDTLRQQVQGTVVGGPSPGVPAPLAPLSVQPPTAPGASGIHRAGLAGTASPCTP